MKSKVNKLAVFGLLAMLSVSFIGSASAKKKGKESEAPSTEKITAIDAGANTVTVDTATGSKVVTVTPATKIYNVDSTPAKLTDLKVGSEVNMTMSDATTALDIRVAPAGSSDSAKAGKKDKKGGKKKKGDSGEQ